MKGCTDIHPMEKRGQVEIAAWLIILIVTVGVGYTVANITSLYVADTSTGNYVNYYKCKEIAENMNKDSIKIFSSKKDVEKEFNVIEGCG